jgi:hypothetical protein
MDSEPVPTPTLRGGTQWGPDRMVSIERLIYRYIDWYIERYSLVNAGRILQQDRP